MRIQGRPRRDFEVAHEPKAARAKSRMLASAGTARARALRRLCTKRAFAAPPEHGARARSPPAFACLMRTKNCGGRRCDRRTCFARTCFRGRSCLVRRPVLRSPRAARASAVGKQLPDSSNSVIPSMLYLPPWLPAVSLGRLSSGDVERVHASTRAQPSSSTPHARALKDGPPFEHLPSGLLWSLDRQRVQARPCCPLCAVRSPPARACTQAPHPAPVSPASCRP